MFDASPLGKKIDRILSNKKKFTPAAAIGELRRIYRDHQYFKIKSFVVTNSETIQCDDNISELAGQLKKDKSGTRIGWVDFIIIATAKVKNLTVCSTDHHFDQFNKIIDIQIFER